MEYVPATVVMLAARVWRPGIGDPTVMAWVITVAYFIAAGLCARAARRERRDRVPLGQQARPAFWWFLVALLLVLGINKQLDLQNLLTAIGRRMAREQGWYRERRDVQVAFIKGVAAVGLLAITCAGYAIRRSWRRHGIALAGVVLLVCFIAIRAASFHHVDIWLRWQGLQGIRLHALLELAGIAITALGALLSTRSRFLGPCS